MNAIHVDNFFCTIHNLINANFDRMVKNTCVLCLAEVLLPLVTPIYEWK